MGPSQTAASEITMEDCFNYYKPDETPTKFRLSASSTLGVTLSEGPNNKSDERSAVVMSLNHPDSTTRAEIATIILYYCDFNLDSAMSCRNLADLTYAAFKEQNFSSANFVLIDLRVLFKNPNHTPNRGYHSIIRNTNRILDLSYLQLTGYLYSSNGVVIDIATFLHRNPNHNPVIENVRYIKALRPYLGKDTLFPKITNSADYLTSWVKFDRIVSNDSTGTKDLC
jgi:hypothetical protein